MNNLTTSVIDPLLKEKLEIILGEIATYATTVESLSESVMNNDLKNGHVAVMLQCMAQRIGWVADRGLDEILSGQIRGDADGWMLNMPPFAEKI